MEKGKALRLAMVLVIFAVVLRAHPMGNFSVNHYARIQPGVQGVEILYVLDLAEIPTFELMQKTIWLNGFSEMVESHLAAAFNLTGRRELHLGLSSGHHSLFPVERPSGSQAAGTEGTEVSLVKLDDVLASREKLDVIKIDAEGAELEVLEGATAVIERSPQIALVVEFGPSHLRRARRSTSDWFGQFAKRGLKYRAIHELTGALEDRTPEQLERAVSTNLLFARAEARAWRKAEVAT